MKFFKIYQLTAILLLNGCSVNSDKKEVTLRKEVVFAIPSDDSLIGGKQKLNVASKHFSYLEYLFSSYELLNIQSFDSTIKVDLRYAGTNNFLNRDLYDGLTKAYFNCEAAIKINNAQHFLKQIKPNYSLVILDAARPWHIQKLMWDSLRMDSYIKYSYLSPPYEASLHNYGCAVDLTIIDLQTGKLLDMGTDFDSFNKLSQPMYEAEFLKTGELSQQAFDNRKLLRDVMTKAQLKPINSEWWHFSICTKPEAVLRFKLIR